MNAVNGQGRGSGVGSRLPAIVLLAASLLEILAMAFHPTARGFGTQAWLDDVVAISMLSLHVHMAMIALVIATWLALSWALRDVGSLALSWAAGKLYGLGVGAMTGAALVNGFATGDYARRMLRMDDLDVAASLSTMTFAHSLNQALAGFGTVVLSCALVAWSINLARGPGRLAKIAGFYGLVAGAACCIAYASGALRLDVHGMMAVVVVQAVWCVLVAGSLLRSR